MAMGVDTEPYMPEVICPSLNALLSCLLVLRISKFFADPAMYFEFIWMVL